MVVDLLAVLSLLALLLGADDWSVRAAATRALTLSYPASASILVRLADDPRADPEARARARGILRACGYGRDRHEVAAERALSELTHQIGYAAWPWIDSLPEGTLDRQATIRAYLERARGAWDIHGTPPDWPSYRAATALLIRDRLAAGATVNEVVLLLRRMVDGDRRQWERSGQTWAWAGSE